MKTRLTILFTSLVAKTIFAAADQKEVLLAVAGMNNGQNDITQIYFAKGINTQYVNLEDAEKQFNPSTTQIYSFTSNTVPCTSNGFGDFTETTSIEIGIQTPAAGTYVLSANSISNFDPSSLVLLEDKTTGIMTNLTNGSVDTVQIGKAGRNDGRFYLHITYPVSLSVTSSGCTNNDGVVAVNSPGSFPWTAIYLLDSNGTVTASVKDTNGNVSFPGLAAGSYSVSFLYNNYNVSKPAQLNTRQVDVSIHTASPTAAVGQNIAFYSNASNADKYTWYFGDSDSSIVTGVANPQFSYYQPGDYTVLLHAANDFSCAADTRMTVSVSEATGLTNNALDQITLITSKKDIIVSTGKSSDVRYTFEVYDLSGQLMLANPLTDAFTTIHMETAAAGIYVVNIKTEYGNFTKKVYLD